MRLREALGQLVRGEEGLQAVEWAVLGSAIAIACLVLYASVGHRVGDLIADLRRVF